MKERFTQSCEKMIVRKPNYIDMMLYNDIYNCYVIVELKIFETNINIYESYR